MGRLGITVGLSLAGIMAVCMALVAMIGFGCLSLYLYLATILTPALAALGVAIAALMFALLVLAFASLIQKRRRVRDTGSFDQLAEALDLGKSLGDEGRKFLTANLSRTALGAFGFGIAMGLSPKLRRAVFDLLKR